MKNILIIYHSQSGIVEKMAYAVKMGVESIDESLQVELKKAQDAGWDDLKMADGIAIGTPDYFDYMAGTVKDFFDRTFYPSQSRIEGSLTANLPCVFFTSGGLGGEPAIESLQKISTAFKFKVIDYVTAGSKLNAEIINRCEESGKKLGTSILEDKKFD